MSTAGTLSFDPHDLRQGGVTAMCRDMVFAA
jgi:hypothetical protein